MPRGARVVRQDDLAAKRLAEVEQLMAIQKAKYEALQNEYLQLQSATEALESSRKRKAPDALDGVEKRVPSLTSLNRVQGQGPVPCPVCLTTVSHVHVECFNVFAQ